MFYDFDFTIDKQTTEAGKVEQVVRLAPGIIKEVVILSSESFAALVHLQIYDRTWQLWPTNLGGAFLLTGGEIKFSEEYELREKPYELTLKGWNEDDSYDHTPHIRLSILPTKGPWTTALLEALFGKSRPVELK